VVKPRLPASRRRRPPDRKLRFPAGAAFGGGSPGLWFHSIILILEVTRIGFEPGDIPLDAW